MLGAPRLEEKTIDLSAIDCLDRVFQLGHAGHHQAHGSRRTLADPLEQLDAGHAGKVLIGKDEVDVAFRETLLRRFRAIGRQDVEFTLKKLSERGEDVGVIIDDKDGTLVEAHGQVSCNHPFPGAGLWAGTVPALCFIDYSATKTKSTCPPWAAPSANRSPSPFEGERGRPSPLP